MLFRSSFVECAAALARAAAPEDDALVSETCCSLAKCIVAVCKEHDSAHSFMPEVVLNMETFISSRLSLVLQQHFQRMPFRNAPSFLNALDTQALNWVHQMTLMPDVEASIPPANLKHDCLEVLRIVVVFLESTAFSPLSLLKPSGCRILGCKLIRCTRPCAVLVMLSVPGRQCRRVELVSFGSSR